MQSSPHSAKHTNSSTVPPTAPSETLHSSNTSVVRKEGHGERNDDASSSHKADRGKSKVEPFHRRSSSHLLEMITRRQSTHGFETKEGAALKQPPPLLRFSSLSLTIAWWLSALGVLLSFALSEVFQAQAPDFPLTFAVVLGCHLNILCALVVYLLGRCRYPESYGLYQPFVGGQRFVLLQLFGILSLSVTTVWSVSFLISYRDNSVRRGTLAMAGVLSLMGNALLLLSLRYFDPSSSGQAAGRSFLALLDRRPNRETVLVVFLIVAQVVLSEIAANAPWMATFALLCTSIIQVVNGGLIHLVIGCLHTEGYRLFMPFLTCTTDTIISWFLEALYFAAVYVNAYMLQHADTAVHIDLLVSVALNVISTGGLLLFTRITNFNVGTHHSLVEHSGFVMIGIAVVISSVNLGILVYLQHRHVDTSAEKKKPKGDDGVALVVALLQSFLMVLTPLTIASGAMIYGKDFRLFRSSRISLAFVILRSLGWLFFVLAFINLALFLFTYDVTTCAMATIAATMSVMLQSFSIREFGLALQRSKSGPNRRAALPQQTSEQPNASPCNHQGSEARSHHGNDEDGAEGHLDVTSEDDVFSIINGESIIGILLALTSLMLRLVVDIADHGVWRGVDLPINNFLVIANLCFMCSIPVVHSSARHNGINVFQPFSGSGSFVALQVLGWTTYASFLSAEIMAVVVHINHGPAPHEWLFLTRMNSFWCTMVGILQLIPLVLITLSIAIQSHRVKQIEPHRGVAQESFDCLRDLVRDALQSAPDACQATTQLAFETMMKPALKYYKIPYTKEMLQVCHVDFLPASPSGGISSFSRSGVGDEATEFDEEERGYRRGSARLITILMSCASATSYVVAAFFTRVTIFSLAFAVCGLVLCTASCIGLHVLYGYILYGKTAQYTYFMPFKGGVTFVKQQILGWSCYAMALLITLIAAVEANGISPCSMLTAAMFSVASQVFIVNSIAHFVPTESEQTFLEENGEGMVALFTVVGAFLFGHLYRLLHAFFAADTESVSPLFFWSRAIVGTTPQSTRQTRVPFVLTVLSMSVAVPCILLALGRTSRQWKKVAQNSKLRKARDFSSATHLGGGSSLWATAVTNTLEVVIILLSTSVPFMALLLVYYLSGSYSPAVFRVVDHFAPMFLWLIVATLALSVVPYVLNVGVPRFAITLRVSFVTWALYGLAVLCGAAGILPAVFCPSVGTYYVALNLFALTILGSYKQVRIALRIGAFALVGLRTFYEYEKVRKGGNAIYGNTRAITAAVVAYAGDVFLLMFWNWYILLYRGTPQLNGAQFSPRFFDFARKYLFSNCVDYFRFKIIVDDESVHMRDDSTQYLFSFHPHGVFPGTALFCTMTEEWKQKVGTNPNRRVSTHAASIVFNVPGVRDFNLRLGAYSVSRRGIEASLARGNSIIIVSGGQAEMLHTSISNTSMTLVTQHTGFVRLAIANKVPLVPLLCFAENNVMGLLQFPRVQRIMLKILGFPFPMIPYGRFWLPIPRRTPLSLVVGKAIEIPKDADSENPQHVADLSKQYFSELKALFYRRRAEAGYPSMELELVNDREVAAARKAAHAEAKAQAKT